MPPFIVLGLPRSRTAWLSKFLTYGDWVCGHEELRHMRSLSDARAWFAQPCIGTAETEAARWWRLFKNVAPGLRVVTIRRPVAEVVASLQRIPRVSFEGVEPMMRSLDRKLDQIEARLPGVLSVPFADLEREDACAAVFEHCLPYAHDAAHWARLAPVNIQINFYAMTRYIQAYREPLARLATIARQQMLADLETRPPVAADGLTIAPEDFDTWLRDARHLFEAHLVRVGEAPDDWRNKNLAMMRTLYEGGAMQIMGARCNGRMFGYLMTLISPSLSDKAGVTATNTTFFASPEFPGLGMKLQRATLAALKARGVTEVFWEAGKRGDGPRLGTMYKRLGAVEHGQTYRLSLAEV